MERKLIGYCGIVCSDCPVSIATRLNDDAERKKVAEVFNRQYREEQRPNRKPYQPIDINCDGCTSGSSRVFYYCGLCQIRICGKQRNVDSCASCSEYPCPRLSGLFAKYSKAKDTLDGIRQGSH